MIGRAAAPALARDGWEVVAVSRSGSLPDGFAELGIQRRRGGPRRRRAAARGGRRRRRRRRRHGRLRPRARRAAQWPLGHRRLARRHLDRLGVRRRRGPRARRRSDSHLPYRSPRPSSTVEPGDPENYSRGKAALEQGGTRRAAALDFPPRRARSTGRARSCRESSSSSSARSTAAAASRSPSGARAASTLLRWRTSPS